MTTPTTRLSVPPRDLAATITALSVLRAGWAVSIVYLVLSQLTLLCLWVDRSYSALALLPIAALFAIAATLSFVARKPTFRKGVIFLVVGTIATYFWVFGLLVLDPSLNTQGIYLLNRMTVVLILIGAVSSRLIHGVLWCASGWALGSLATVLAQLSVGVDMSTGYGPLLSMVIYIVILVMFVLIKQSQLRFNPAFSDSQIEPARITGQRELEERAVVLLHDTVLNDLIAIFHGKERLDERTRARFLGDIRAVEEAEVEPEAAGSDAEGWLRREFLTMVNDFQWRGLRVDITGEAPIRRRTSPRVAEVMAGAIRGCLENIVRHSASDSAELFIDFSESDLSVMVVDHGVGFDLNLVPGDRLGIRQSIVQRIESVGGNVKIWSAIGAGTSVVVSVPLGGEGE